MTSNTPKECLMSIDIVCPLVTTYISRLAHEKIHMDFFSKVYR